MITDEQSLVGARSQWGSEITIYDDGFGPLWIMRDSLGIVGIIRAQSWEIAWEIAEDEFFPEASETIADFEREYGMQWFDNECWNEV